MCVHMLFSYFFVYYDKVLLKYFTVGDLGRYLCLFYGKNIN